MQQIFSDENKCLQKGNIFLWIGKRNYCFYTSIMELVYDSITPLIQINWDLSYPDMQEIGIIEFFVENRVYIGSLNFGCYYLHYVPASKPSYHS